MGHEQSLLRCLRPNDSEDQDPSRPAPRINVDGEEVKMSSIHFAPLDNNDNSGQIDRAVIPITLISNCQEESEIQLEDSCIDNNCNKTTEIANNMSGLTRNLHIIIEESIIPEL